MGLSMHGSLKYLNRERILRIWKDRKGERRGRLKIRPYVVWKERVAAPTPELNGRGSTGSPRTDGGRTAVRPYT